jgi:predicted GH43/DUF377 family glycosyl hydrolase
MLECETKCGKARDGRPYRKDEDCFPCWLEKNSAGYRKIISRNKSVETTVCPHFGKPTGETRACKTCSGKVELKLFACAVHGSCTVKKKTDGVACCEGCPDKPKPPIPNPLSIQRIDSAALKLGRVGEAFNSSLFRFKKRLLLCYRTGWSGARLHVAELDKDMTPKKVTTLNGLGHPRATVGQEDPRLFEYQGRLHVSFTGVERSGGGVVTNVLYARLTDDFRIEEVFAPNYFGRRSWEKNWVFFEWEGMLLAVYSIAPHVILHIRGNQAYPLAETNTAFPWSGGTLRGGCPPVRVGDTFYHWFHGRHGAEGDEQHKWHHSKYTIGLYTFPARYPFAIERMTPDPILIADYETLPDDQKRSGNPAVVFPAGAILERGQWAISMGVHDRWTDVAKWDAAEVDKMLGLDPPAAPIEGDIVLSSAFLHCGDTFGVMPAGRTDRVPLKSLTDAEMVAFFRTLTHTAETWGVNVVLLHDGLPNGVLGELAAKGVRCELVKPDRHISPYEARWFVYRDFLERHDGITRSWFVDAGDVVFTRHPFLQYDRDVIVVGVDEIPYNVCPWQRGQLDHLPPSWSDSLSFDLPPNAGTWMASRDNARRIVAETCVLIEQGRKYLADHPAPSPVVVDMAAFGLAVIPRGPRSFPRKGGDPLFHDRVLCDEHLSRPPSSRSDADTK